MTEMRQETITIDHWQEEKASELAADIVEVLQGLIYDEDRCWIYLEGTNDIIVEYLDDDDYRQELWGYLKAEYSCESELSLFIASKGSTQGDTPEADPEEKCHGIWVDLEVPYDINAKLRIDLMMAFAPDDVGEWFIAKSNGFPEKIPDDLDDICELAEAISELDSENKKEEFIAYLNLMQGLGKKVCYDTRSLINDFNTAFLGHFDTEAAFAQSDFVKEVCSPVGDVPDFWYPHIDWQSVFDSIMSNGDGLHSIGPDDAEPCPGAGIWVFNIHP